MQIPDNVIDYRSGADVPYLELRGWKLEDHGFGVVGWRDCSPPPPRPERKVVADAAEVKNPTFDARLAAGHKGRDLAGYTVSSAGVSVVQHYADSPGSQLVSAADAMRIELARDRPALPAFRPRFCTCKDRWFVQDRYRRILYELHPFETEGEAMAFCDATERPGACQRCGEHGEPDHSARTHFDAQLRAVEDWKIRRDLEEAWRRETHWYTVPETKRPPVPTDLLDQPDHSQRLTMLRRATVEWTIAKCSACSRWPARYPPPAVEVKGEPMVS